MLAPNQIPYDEKILHPELARARSSAFRYIEMARSNPDPKARRLLLIDYYEFQRMRMEEEGARIESLGNDYFLILGHLRLRDEYRIKMEVVFAAILATPLPPPD